MCLAGSAVLLYLDDKKSEENELAYTELIKKIDNKEVEKRIIDSYNKIDVAKAVRIAKEESKNGEFLIERYMVGAQDMSFAYFITDGKPYLLKLGDRYLGNIDDNLDRQQMATIMPSMHTDYVMENVNPNIEKMIQALGIKFGSVFLQLLLLLQMLLVIYHLMFYHFVILV